MISRFFARFRAASDGQRVTYLIGIALGILLAYTLCDVVVVMVLPTLISKLIALWGTVIEFAVLFVIVYIFMQLHPATAGVAKAAGKFLCKLVQKVFEGLTKLLN